MAFPFLATAIATYFVFFVTFRGWIVSHVRSTFEERNLPSDRRPSLLNNGVPSPGPSALLNATLGVSVGTSVLVIPVWQITVPPAVIIFIRDVAYERYTPRSAPQLESIEKQPPHHRWARPLVFLLHGFPRTYTNFGSTSSKTISLHDSQLR